MPCSCVQQSRRSTAAALQCTQDAGGLSAGTGGQLLGEINGTGGKVKKGMETLRAGNGMDASTREPV